MIKVPQMIIVLVSQLKPVEVYLTSHIVCAFISDSDKSGSAREKRANK